MARKIEEGVDEGGPYVLYEGNRAEKFLLGLRAAMSRSGRWSPDAKIGPFERAVVAVMIAAGVVVSIWQPGQQAPDMQEQPPGVGQLEEPTPPTAPVAPPIVADVGQAPKPPVVLPTDSLPS